MINNINGSPLRSVVNSNNETPVKPAGIGENGDKKTPPVTGALSGAIAHMTQQGAPLDMQKITSVRDAIANGQYPVDPLKIAEKMIEFDQTISEFS